MDNYHTHVIKSPIENNNISVEFDYGNEEGNTELCQKVLIQVSLRELHIDTLKKSYWFFHGIQQKMTCTY